MFNLIPIVKATQIHVQNSDIKISDWEEIKEIKEDKSLNIKLFLEIFINNTNSFLKDNEVLFMLDARERMAILGVKEISVSGCDNFFIHEICRGKEISVDGVSGEGSFQYKFYLNKSNEINFEEGVNRIYIKLKLEVPATSEPLIKNGEAAYIGWFETKCSDINLCPIDDKININIILPKGSIIDKLENLEFGSAPLGNQYQPFINWRLEGKGYDKKIVFYRNLDEERYIKFRWLLYGILITIFIKSVWVSFTKESQKKIIRKNKKIWNIIYFIWIEWWLSIINEQGKKIINKIKKLKKFYNIVYYGVKKKQRI